jgi:chromosome segregation ATPase
MAIGGAVFMGAWEVYNHDFSNSTDVYRGPGKPSVTLPLNTSIAPSIESLEESTSVSSITEVPTFTTTEYITITQTPKNENNGPTSAPYIYGSMNGRNPYANNSYVQSMIHTIAPIYGNSFVKALVKIIQIVWNNFFIQHIVRLITSVISFGFYLWALLPGGLQGLVELLVGWSTLFGALIWLWQWLFPRGNTAPPADGSPPPSSDGRPGGDGGEPPSGVPGSTDASAGPKPSTNTTSAGTQTTTNTTSTETQTVISNSTVSQAERDCQRTLQRVRNELEEARASTAANDQTIAHQEQRITDLQQGNTDLRQIVEGLRQSHAQDAKIIEELTELNIERGRQESGTITYLRDNVNTFRMQRDKTAELHADEIKDLQAERDTAVTDLESATESHQEEIKRLNEAHEAEVNEIKSSRDATIEKLQSEVDDLHRDVEKLEHANEGLRNQNTAYDEEISSNPGTPVSTKAAEKRHKLELEEAIAKEKAKARNEVDQLKKKVSQLEKEQQKEKSKKKKTDSSLFASPPEDESEQVRKFREENSRLTGLLFKKDATEKQNKLSAEAQKEQETALADCNDKVQALENTNTELAKQNEALQSTNNQLTQQNETLQEQEAQAKDAEEKSRSRADGLQVEVESLKTSLSNAGDGNKAAVQAAEDLRVAEERSNDRESNLQRQLAQARDTENGLENRLSQGELQLQDTQARLERSQTDLENTQTALNTTQAELHKSQAEDKRLRGEGQAILNERESLKLRCTTAENERDALRSNNDILQADRAKLQAKNDSLQKGGDELTINYNALQQALAEQHKKCSEEKKQLLQRTRAEQERKCNEEKQKLRKEAQAAYDHEKSNGKNLREQLRQQQEQNEELQDEITGLNNEIEMKDKNIANLISTNQGLANQDLESGMARALREAADAEEEMEDDTNQPPQQTPFTNAPSFPPSQPATAPPHSPKRGSGAPDVFDVQSNTKSSNALARKIAPLRSSRNNSPTRKLTGESEDPAQAILDSLN